MASTTAAAWAWATPACGPGLVADGTPEAAERLRRVLTNDPGIGVAQHFADAGYDQAREFARRAGIDLPMLNE